MATINGKWTLVHKDQSLQRSSQTLSTLHNHALIFGGELLPRKPRDNDVHILNLSPPTDSSRKQKASCQTFSTGLDETPSTSTVPSARVGTASTVVNNKIYYFSGRGGIAMSPLDEKGGIWEFHFSSTDGRMGWQLILPANATLFVPEARSYHCMTSDTNTTIYLHAGCPTSGRLSDLWSFDTHHRTWKQLASAPGSPRGGTSITFSNGKLYRMGGFDGTHELGGQIDIYDIATNIWSTHTFTPDGKQGPGCRSVATLLAITVDGHPSLITAFGESDPSALGHAGAGNMLPDTWIWDIKTQQWSQVIGEEEGTPLPRGWFAADVVGYEGKEGIIVQGGLAEDNERLDDAWVLTF